MAVLLIRIYIVNQPSAQTAHEWDESADLGHMRMRCLCAALIFGLAGCVSDDQPTASPTTSESAQRSTSTTNSDGTSTDPTADLESAADSTSTSDRPNPTEPQDGEPVESSDSESRNSSDSTERTQGKPITVTTVGAKEIGKKAVKSNVTVTDSWCEASETGSLLALAEIANSGALEGDFIVEFEVLNALGVRVGEGVDVVHEVKPGQSFVARETVADAVGWEGDPRSWTCQVLRISTPDATLSE